MEIKAIGDSEGKGGRDKQFAVDVYLSRKGSVCLTLMPVSLPVDSHRPRLGLPRVQWWTRGLGFGDMTD